MSAKRTRPIANGSIRKDGRNARRVFVSFDDDTWDEIRAYAAAQQTSFTGAVRQLVEFGLIDAKQLRAA